jgi:hypothetical protein
MTFVPDSSASYQSYLYAKGLIVAENRDQYDVDVIMYLCSLIDAATTLVANTGSRTAPNGSIAATILAANGSQYQGRNF